MPFSAFQEITVLSLVDENISKVFLKRATANVETDTNISLGSALRIVYNPDASCLSRTTEENWRLKRDLDPSLVFYSFVTVSWHEQKWSTHSYSMLLAVIKTMVIYCKGITTQLYGDDWIIVSHYTDPYEPISINGMSYVTRALKNVSHFALREMNSSLVACFSVSILICSSTSSTLHCFAWSVIYSTAAADAKHSGDSTGNTWYQNRFSAKT